ncbi:oxygen-dependent tRNA uridine(34) hydroxylase TrhO [Salinibacillus xinjiangensis]|uniref:tRNA uridine(34) hydroxylase n=1 Tax=Salinibacillus xinjiangensis TaxID=1229268 RepID=A0A6G1X4F8_9BACI|nr:rhodanese-related sulfurtransferase [Salinibacillus xinjiangensis]MRG85786.1 rhodanese-related sulfurtransferase [Salinibacillus xinjiangensis]
MDNKEKYQVLLYYKFVTIDDPETFTAEHLQYCKDLGLKGRILIAEEGINGTVSGTVEQTNKYMEDMHNDPRFSDMMFKVDEADGHTFKKMHVRHRPELVTLRLEDEWDPAEETAEFLNPKEFYEAMQDENTVVLDTRNDYEYELGHFRGAINPDIETFRELPEWIKENKEELEGKKVLMYCTGGIRCEKFSGWLQKEGITDVGQLHGGIVTYGKDPEVQGELWDGKCYVFDERISVPVNRKEHVVVGKDYFDGTPCERFVNCADPDCNRQFLCSEENEHKYMRGCSHECRVSPRNRYVIEHGLTEEDVQERLAKIEEEDHVKQA